MEGRYEEVLNLRTYGFPVQYNKTERQTLIQFAAKFRVRLVTKSVLWQKCFEFGIT